jgi:AcrR family transcriptional regulator
MRVPTASRIDLTRRIIVEAAVGLLERESLREVTMRAVAQGSGISERTIFRYFKSHGDLLDAVAGEVTRRFSFPPDATSVSELIAYSEALYARYEQVAALTRSTVHSDLRSRMHQSVWRSRYAMVRAIVDRAAPNAVARERKIAITNIAYYLTASTWDYLRTYFDLSPGDAVACARTAVVQALRCVRVRCR